MYSLYARAIILTRVTALRRGSNGTYAAVKNINVADTLAAVQAIDLFGNQISTLDGVEFCTNLRILNVCLPCARAAVSGRRSSLLFVVVVVGGNFRF